MSSNLMKRFITSEKQQGFLFSQHYTCDYLKEDDEVFTNHFAASTGLFDKLIDALNLKSIYSSYSPEGGSTYNPRDMLGVILYAFFKGVTSSRKIAELTSYNIRFIHLSGNHQMSYRTILNFKTKNRVAMESLFTSSVENALTVGLVQYDQIFALDGTKLNAYANIQKTKSKEEWTEFRKQILTSVQEYFNESEQVDLKEDQTFGESDKNKDLLYQNILSELKKLAENQATSTSPLPPVEADNEIENSETENSEKKKSKKSTPVHRQKKVTSLEEAKNALDKCSQIDTFLVGQSSEEPNKKINMTDPDSKMMKSDDNIKQRYNAQIISNQQIIVAANLTNEENDQNQLKPMVDQLQENLNTESDQETEENAEANSDSEAEPSDQNQEESTRLNDDDEQLQFVADAGYNAGANLEYLDKQENIDSYISMHRRDESALEAEDKCFLKENFEYDEAEDEWVCPAGNRLENYGESITKNGNKETRYTCQPNTCQDCSFYSKCVKTKDDLQRGYRTIIDNGTLIYRKEMKDKMSLEESKQIYSKRSGEVEPIFGQMKYNQRIRGFAYRGLDKFKSEFFTLCLAHNLGKIMRYQLKMDSLAS